MSKIRTEGSSDKFLSSGAQGQSEISLTNREKDVLVLIACGYTNKHAARKLEISPYTIAGYIKDIYRKLEIGCRSEATLIAVEAGLIDTRLRIKTG